MKKNLSLVQLTSLPDTLNVSEMMNVLGGSGIDDSISKCLIISIAVKCSGTSAVMCSSTPAISCAPNVSAVTCKGGGALKKQTQNLRLMAMLKQAIG